MTQMTHDIVQRLFAIEVLDEFPDLPPEAQDFMTAMQVKMKEMADERDVLQRRLDAIAEILTEALRKATERYVITMRHTEIQGDGHVDS